MVECYSLRFCASLANGVKRNKPKAGNQGGWISEDEQTLYWYTLVSDLQSIEQIYLQWKDRCYLLEEISKQLLHLLGEPEEPHSNAKLQCVEDAHGEHWLLYQSSHEHYIADALGGPIYCHRLCAPLDEFMEHLHLVATDPCYRSAACYMLKAPASQMPAQPYTDLSQPDLSELLC